MSSSNPVNGGDIQYCTLPSTSDNSQKSQRQLFREQPDIKSVDAATRRNPNEDANDNLN